MKYARITAAISGLVLVCYPLRALSWNIPTHMVTGAIAYQLLAQEGSTKIIAVRTMLESHPWYSLSETRIHAQPNMNSTELLFMFAARWADDLRMQSKTERERRWHYIDWPFKPEGEPKEVAVTPPHPKNILSALIENERTARSTANDDQRAIALAWLFHLVGDVHQPLNTVQLFTREYPLGDRGGSEICVRVTAERGALDLHSLWDSLITSTIDMGTLSNMARELRGKLPKEALHELSVIEPKLWARSSYELATTSAYLRGELRGTPKGRQKECREVANAELLPDGYTAGAKYISTRRVVLAGYRLAELLTRIVKQ